MQKRDWMALNFQLLNDNRTDPDAPFSIWVVNNM